MNSPNKTSEELAPTSHKWVSDDDTISDYGHYGAILGAVLGSGLVLSSILHCRMSRNSQGCGFESVGSALFFYGLMIVLSGGLALYLGRLIGQMPPPFRGVSAVFCSLIFFFRFAWSTILMWLQPDLQGTLWDKPFRAWATIALLIIYGLLLWPIKRRFERQQLNS